MTLQLFLDQEQSTLVESESCRPWATMSELSIADDPNSWPDEIAGGRLVLRCAAIDGPPDPARWLDSAWDAFDDAVRGACDAAEKRGLELMIRPSVKGMLSDAIGTASWARRMGSTRVGLVLDPVGWLADSMIPDGEDHLHRIADLMIGCEKNAAVIVQVSTGQGDLDPTMVLGALGALIADAGVLVALDPRDLDRVRSAR